MKAATAIGIVVACAMLAAGATMEGTPLMVIFNVPAILIVIGGLAGVTLASEGMEGVKAIPLLYKKVIGGERPDLAGNVREMVAYAELARREGLLALEQEVEKVEDDFTKKGLQLVVDGTDPELVREILDAEIDAMATRHKQGAEVFKNASGFAPTMGIIGTVMGLVHVLQNLDKPETLGPSISGAFIATLLGVGSANVVFLPVALRLKSLSASEVESRTLITEGILAVQAGDNPRVVAEKLVSFVPPAERADAEPQKPNLRAVDGGAGTEAEAA